jgi:uracil-DNA glycosylase family 4
VSINKVFDEAQYCDKCFGNNKISVPYPDPKNALGVAKILYINERPGRRGTGESGYISFDNNDPSANFFKECFLQLQIDRKDIFITNACLCHPEYNGYVDTKPTTTELRNCHFWLKQQIAIVRPKLIVTIGNVALNSLKWFFSYSNQIREYELKSHIGSVIKDTEPWVYPLYHTSQRGRLSRNAHDQKKDWLKIVQILRELST